jgi:hypothetical protein
MLCDLGIIKANLYPTVENDIVVYKYSTLMNYFFIGLNLTDFILSYFLLKWKKWAFWLLTLTSATSICFSIFLDESLFPLIGFLYIIVLFALLQLKKNNVSGWSKLK